MTVSLENRTWYSLLEGMNSPEELVDRAGQLGYQALALTDVNSLMGLPAFVEAAKAKGIKPITGATLRVRSTSIVVLAADRHGYGELSTLITTAQRLEKQAGDVLPEFLQAVAHGGASLHYLVEDPDLLRPLSGWHNGRVWALVTRPRPGMERSRERYIESLLLETAAGLGVPSVASARVLLTHPQKLETAKILWAIRNRGMVDDYPIPGDAFAANSLPSQAEWAKRFADLPQALENTHKLAAMLEGEVLPKGIIFPSPRVRWSIPLSRRLIHLCHKGLRQRGLVGDQDAEDRLEKELGLIQKLGFTGYFLVVRSIARKATRLGLSMALRGSAGNSLVCYLLGHRALPAQRVHSDFSPSAGFLHPPHPVHPFFRNQRRGLRQTKSRLENPEPGPL